jgi:phenylalanyl-tRNA synthetase beta chain
LPEGTVFKTLDEVERKLSSEDLMICDESSGMCIAGVFGGVNSGINANTKNIFLESAFFNPVYIRRTAKRHGLSTDASFRFERGTDPEMPIIALKKAAMMIKEIAGGQISSDITDIYPNPVPNHQVKFSLTRCEKLIGKKIEKEIILKILKGLEIIVEKEVGDVLHLIVPSYRVDVTREADVIEDILRIYGYNNVEISPRLNASITHPPKPDPDVVQNNIADLLSANGFNEIMCNSLTKGVYAELLDKKNNAVEIINPLSNDLNIMRQTLLFGALETIKLNINYRNSNLKLYEFGNIFFANNTNTNNPIEDYHEELRLSLLLTGNKSEANWTVKEEPATFYQLKAYSELILKNLGFNLKTLNQQHFTSVLFSDAMQYSINNTVIAEIGVVSNAITSSFEIAQVVYFADIYWDNLLKLMVNHKTKFSPLAKYPEVRRDLALLIDKQVTFKQIVDLAYKSEKNLLQQVDLFDVYENEKLGHNKKSYAVSFILQDKSKTLTDQEIDKVMKTFIKTFEKELQAQIR